MRAVQANPALETLKCGFSMAKWASTIRPVFAFLYIHTRTRTHIYIPACVGFCTRLHNNLCMGMFFYMLVCTRIIAGHTYPCLRRFGAGSDSGRVPGRRVPSSLGVGRGWVPGRCRASRGASSGHISASGPGSPRVQAGFGAGSGQGSGANCGAVYSRQSSGIL